MLVIFDQYKEPMELCYGACSSSQQFVCHIFKEKQPQLSTFCCHHFFHTCVITGILRNRFNGLNLLPRIARSAESNPYLVSFFVQSSTDQFGMMTVE